MNEKMDNITNTMPSPKNKEAGWDSLGIETYIKIAIIAVLFWFLFSDELYKIVYRWIKDSSWSHGFLIPFFSLYFLHLHKDKIVRLETRRSYVGLFLMICCIAFYPLNIAFFKIGYLTQRAMIGALGSLVLFLGGWGLLRYAWLPVAYLIFAVPLPGGVYRSITIPMRILASQVSTAILNIVPDLQATASGVVIDVIYKGVKLDPS